jgi:MtaA/CmuA family methyltransferase
LLYIFRILRGNKVTGRELVKTAFKCETVDNTPWVPFVGCHGGALLGVTATEYLKNAALVEKGMAKAVALYQPDGIPVVFDLQIEAEALGCELVWADATPPAVCKHPLANGTKLDDLKVPGKGQARIAIAMDAAARLRRRFPDLALYGLVTGPFTLALHLLGTDIFMKMFDDSPYVDRLMRFCRDVTIAMSSYYIDAGCDIIAVVDPMTSQIGPDQFSRFVTPPMADVFASVRSRKALSSFFVCGHAQQNISVMCDCRPDNVSVDENIPLDFVRDECLKRGISFGGNLQLTTVLLLGEPIDAQKNAIACMDVGNRKGFILAPGCDLPFATPPANLQAIAAIVRDEYQRNVVRAMAISQEKQFTLDMAEYGHADKVIVDIITLDSEACAPCQYMVDAVRKVAPEFDGIVEWREHKIKYRESIVFMTSLMVRNIPTICIDGKITFVSRIPPKNELIEAIQKRINEKFRMKIRRKRATVYILGSDCQARKELLQKVEQAQRELGSDIEIVTVDDPDTIASYGIPSSQTPAIVVAKYQVRTNGHTPEPAVIKEWLKDLA